MELSGDEEQVVFGNELYPVVTSGQPTTPNPPDGSLSGSIVRQVMGTFQIVCGAIEIALGIVVLCVPLQKYYYNYNYNYHYNYNYYHYNYNYHMLPYKFLRDYDEADNVGWGIWNGLFAIVTGSLGMCSSKTKRMVVAYMVTSIIATVSTLVCLVWAAIYIPKANEDSGNYDDDNRSVSFAIYIILCIVFAVQILMSILGASFTCGALSSTNNQPQAVYYYATQPLHQQTAPVLCYCQPSAPPPDYNASFIPVNQSTIPNGDENNQPS